MNAPAGARICACWGSWTAFKRLFGNRNPLLVAARSVGLAVADRSPALKRAFIEQALGLGEDLPRLARR